MQCGFFSDEYYEDLAAEEIHRLETRAYLDNCLRKLHGLRTQELILVRQGKTQSAYYRLIRQNIDGFSAVLETLHPSSIGLWSKSL